MKHNLQTGDLCFYWRDVVNSQKPGPKISWKGPATVVMVEKEPHEVLWLVHGTTMLRASPEHVKPVLTPDPSTTTITIDQPLQRAQLSLQGIRNRGVTQYVDLGKSNKRSRDEVESEDEEDATDAAAMPEPSSVGKLLYTCSLQSGPLRLSDLNLHLRSSSRMIGLWIRTRPWDFSGLEPQPFNFVSKMNLMTTLTLRSVKSSMHHLPRLQLHWNPSLHSHQHRLCQPMIHYT